MEVDRQIQILIVEDNESIGNLLSNILRSAGFKNVTEAINGKMALEKIEQKRFDLILTDWMMPEMDGLELVKKIRTGSDDVKHIPILMISASESAKDIVKTMDWKINGYLVKPFSVDTILSMIEDVINKRERY